MHVFALRIFGMGHVSFCFKYNVVLRDRVLPSKKPKISVLCFVVISVVGVPWDLVFLLDLWLLEPHEDPTETEEKPKSQTKSLVILCTSDNSLI